MIKLLVVLITLFLRYVGTHTQSLWKFVLCLSTKLCLVSVASDRLCTAYPLSRTPAFI